MPTRIITKPQEYNEDGLFIDLEPTVGRRLYLKCEGFNFAGSIKLKAAAEMVATAEREGRLTADSVLIESSSGNLGLALSMIAANRGYSFVCVTDARSNKGAVRAIEAFGARVHVITEPDPETGFLGARLAYVRELCEREPRCVWLNQYTNEENWRAHYRATAPAIAAGFHDLDVVFVGAGTTGTLMGCARYFREHLPSVRVVGIDSEGSVTFGGPPRVRMIPGLGAGVESPFFDASYLADTVYVPEAEAVRACRRMVRSGFLFGGSTGTVVSGALSWLAQHDPRGLLTAVAVAPDLGDRYLGSVYDDMWVRQHFGADVLLADSHQLPSAAGDGLPAVVFA